MARTWTPDDIAESLRNYNAGYGTPWNGPPAWLLAGQRSGDLTVNPALQLQLTRQYDPNAQLQHVTSTGALDANGLPQGDVINFDESKLPQQQVPGLQQFAAERDLKFRNPNAIYNDPNYGPMTLPGNARYTNDEPGWMEIVGPMLVGGFAGLGAGGFSWLTNAITKLPNVANMVSNAFQPQRSGITPQQAALYRMLSENRG